MLDFILKIDILNNLFHEYLNYENKRIILESKNYIYKGYFRNDIKQLLNFLVFKITKHEYIFFLYLKKGNDMREEKGNLGLALGLSSIVACIVRVHFLL